MTGKKVLRAFFQPESVNCYSTKNLILSKYEISVTDCVPLPLTYLKKNQNGYKDTERLKWRHRFPR